MPRRPHQTERRDRVFKQIRDIIARWQLAREAVLDAAAACSPDLAREVDALCARAAGRAGEADAAEWAELSPTIVQFEEL